MKKGFTLAELLVAATIISGLAVFATVQYRNSIAETQWANAKIKVEQVAAAVKQLQMDYSNITFLGVRLSDRVTNLSCGLRSGKTNQNPSELIACGYLENSGWGNGVFSYFICPNGTGCSSDYVACVSTTSAAKFPTRYKIKNYCINKDGIGVEGTL